MRGYIKLHRKMREWGWYSDSVVKDLFLHLLLSASYKRKKWRDITIEKGQVVVSHKSLADELGFSVQQIRTAISKLKLTGEITIKSTSKFSVITIVKWEDYQFFDDETTSKSTSEITDEQHLNNNQSTSEQQASNRQSTTSKEYKEYKNINNINNNQIVLFDKMREKISAQMSRTSFGCWFTSLELLGVEDRLVVLGVDKKYTAMTIRIEFWDKLIDAVKETFGVGDIKLIWKQE